MSGEQDILSLGLDISTFDSKKKQELREFISIFNDLSKYDGKIFNPVMGDGLTKFNTSIQQTSSLIDQINSKLSSIASSQNLYTQSVNSNTQALNSNAQASSKANQSSYESISLKLKEAESETRLAASKTKTAQSSLTQHQAELKLAQARLADANSSNKKIRQNEVEVAQQKALASALTVRVFAEKQATASAYQLTVANELEAASAGQSASQQSLASVAVQNAAIQNQRAAAAINASNASISRTAASFTTSQSAAMAFGKTLTGMLSNLRTLAYILPGIGLAGIFNLAFEAIGKAYDALVGFNKQSDIDLKITKDQNASLKERIGIYSELIKSQSQYNELINTFSSLSQQRSLDVMSDRGLSKDVLMPKSVEVAKTRFKEAKNNLANIFNLPGEMFMEDAKGLSQRGFNIKMPDISMVNSMMNQSESKLGVLQRDLDFLTNKAGNSGVFNGVKVDKKQIDKLREAKAAEYESEKEKYKFLYSLSKDYYESESDLNRKQSEYKKYLEDEERRRKTEIAKENIALEISTQEIILNKDISTEKDKLNAVEAIYQQKLKLNKVNFDNVDDNISSSASDKAIAKNKKRDDDRSALQKKEEEQYNIRETYRQRYIKASTEINKNAVEEDAIRNERIYKDETQSLEDRLKAYSIYISKKQTLQDLEYAKDREKHGLTPKELEELDSNRATQKANIQADAEAQVYNIVYTSLHNQMSLIKETNNTNQRENAIFYANELNQLNDAFEKKQIRFERYKKELKRINLKYTLSGFDELIKDDNSDIAKLKQFLSESIGKKKKADDDVETMSIYLDYTQKSGDGNLQKAQLNANKALGIQKALDKAIIDSKKELADKENKLADDTLARAKARAAGIADAEGDSAKRRKLNWNIIEKAEKAIYEIVKNQEDSLYEERIKKAEERKSVVDEQKDLELSAIEKSSLAEKDKQALSIQLSQQKLEFDKQSDREMRMMKHDQAVLDKELSIAQIAIATLLAVMKAAPNIPLEIETAALGAISLAVAMATNIPSYADGILSHPGGFARYAESGPEEIRIPGKNPFIATKETISYLPVGTQVIPLDGNSMDFGYDKKDDSWSQTMYLANQIKKSNRDIKNIYKPTIVVDMNFEIRKRDILGR